MHCTLMFSLGDLIFIYRACIATNNLETLSVFCKMALSFDFYIQHLTSKTIIILTTLDQTLPTLTCMYNTMRITAYVLIVTLIMFAFFGSFSGIQGCTNEGGPLSSSCGQEIIKTRYIKLTKYNNIFLQNQWTSFEQTCHKI